MDAKKQLLKETFESSFDMIKYEGFIRAFFNSAEIGDPYKKIKNGLSDFSHTIASYNHVADYTDGEGRRIAILAVELSTGKTAEYSKSAQRNFISRLILNSGHEAAIVAFYTGNDEKWHLSLVKFDQEWLAGVNVKTSITPAKRLSYLVGENEPCHTAQEQIFPIFKDEHYNPTLDNIEKAFSVETVTDEFFKEYKKKYHDLREELEKSDGFKEMAEKHQFTSEQFAKKLMGQLAFLYFIQKKGWLGVKAVPEVLNEKQYNDVFYRANASRAVIEKIYEQNGEDVFQLNTDLLKSDHFTDEEGDILASGFTSETWGSGRKSFIRDLFNDCEKRKKKFFEDYLQPLFYEALRINRGSNQYYKRFNCKIPFLDGGLFDPIENYDWKDTSFNIPNDIFSTKGKKGEGLCDGIIDIFERYNFTMNEDEPFEREVAVDPEMLGKIFENLLEVKDRKSKGTFYTPREIVHYMCQESLINYLVNEIMVPYEDLKQFILYGEIMKDEDCSKRINLSEDSQRRLPETVFVKLGEIDKALENVKIADPAVGSGAFPIGMLSEILRARNNITAYIAMEIVQSNKHLQKKQRTQYYKSRNPYFIKWSTIKNCIYGVDIEASAVDIAKLRLWLSLIVEEELTPTFGPDKKKDPNPLPNLDCNILCGNSLSGEFDSIKLLDGAFDIVIGNPPYVGEKGHKEVFEAVNKSEFGKKFHQGRIDLFYYFFHKAIDLCKPNGINTFITTNYYITATGGTNLRKDFKKRTIIKKMINFNELKIFESAMGQHNMITILKKSVNPEENAENYMTSRKGFASPEIIQNILSGKDKDTKSYKVKQKNLYEDHEYYIRLEGVQDNEAADNILHNILGKILENTEMLGEICNVNQGARTGADKVTDQHIRALPDGEYIKNEGIFVLNPEEKNRMMDESHDLIKPWFKNSDIIQYRTNTKAHLHVIYSTSKINIDDYTEVKNHLVKYRNILENRNTDYPWWCLDRPRKKQIFEDEKIVAPQRSRYNCFGYNSQPWYASADVYFITKKEEGNYSLKYILGLLNSKLFFLWLYFKGKKKGEMLELYQKPLSEIPIKKISKEDQISLIKLVDQIIEVDHTADTSALEREIDKIIYELYGLTDPEIKIVESLRHNGKSN